MGFGEWLRGERKAHEDGEIDTETYAKHLEKKAEEVPDAGNQAYLKARARFVRDNKENTERDNKPPKGLW